jgi:tetratricopeptide (TPR) repeat protein
MASNKEFLQKIETLSISQQIEVLVEEIDTSLTENSESCLDLIHHLQTISEAENNLTGIFKSQYLQSDFFYQRDDYEKADTYCALAEKIAFNSNNKLWEADTLMLRGKIQSRFGNYREAIVNFEKATATYQNLNDRLKEAEAYFHFSGAYRLLGEYEKAIEMSEKAITISKDLDKPDKLAKNYNDIGVVYMDYGVYDKAITYFYQSLELSETIPLPNLKYLTLSNMGNLYIMMKEYEKSLDYFKLALRELPEPCEKLYYSQILNNIGTLYCLLEDFDKAKTYFFDALTIKTEINDKKGMSSIYNNLGEINFQREQFDESLYFMEKSIEIKRELGLKVGLAQALRNIASIKIKQENFKDGLSCLKEAESLAKQMKSNIVLYRIYESLAEYYHQVKDFEQAYQYLKLYMEIKEQVFSEDSKKNISQLQAKYELEKKEKEKEIYRLKNIELAEANESIQQKNQELHHHREHLRLINKILRHDLVNHLAGIQSSVRLYKANRENEMLTYIEESVKLSVQLIDRMRDLETILITNKQLQTMDLRDILEETIQHFKHKVSFHISGKGKVLADEAISSIFNNIISNAIIHGEATQVSIEIAPRQKFFEVRIANNGSGIPDEIKEKVFEESFTYGKKGNTGLGLFIVKKTIESYQGMVYIEDNQPQGVVFVILFRRVK